MSEQEGEITADHKDLEIWNQALELAKAAHEFTKSFPSSELYGLISQMRRSAVSIASNIAEGAARNSDKNFMHFLCITMGSVAELDTQYIITMGSVAELDTQYILSKELQLTNGSTAIERGMENVRKLTVGLIKHLKNKHSVHS